MSNLSFKSIITTSCLLLAGMIYAQEPVRIECKTGEGIGKNIHLWRVEKGEEKNMVNAGYNGNGYYGFSFIPEYEGFTSSGMINFTFTHSTSSQATRYRSTWTKTRFI